MAGVPGLCVRGDLGLGEVAHQLAQCPLLVGELHVHGVDGTAGMCHGGQEATLGRRFLAQRRACIWRFVGM
jgi:hypothetical protein